MNSRVLEVQEECQAPPLRNVVRFGVDLVQGLLLEHPLPCPWMHAIIQQHRNDLAILARTREAARSTGMERRVQLFFRLRIQGPSVQMPIQIQRQTSIRRAGVHICQVRFHLVRWEHVDMRDAHGLEDVRLEVVVQLHTRNALDELPCPVDVDSVFPCLTGLVNQGLRQVVVVRAREFVDAQWTGPVIQAVVEEGVAEASSMRKQ